MHFNPLSIEGAVEITLEPFRDSRGSFTRTYDRELFAAQGLDAEWVQENQSENNRRRIIRGFHIQAPPHAETKLVRAVLGRVLDVFVDLRSNSSTFLHYEMVGLDADRANMVYIPKGCAHAYLTVSERSIVAYRVDAVYAPEHEHGFRWDDPGAAIPWPLEGEPILSAKDAKWGDLADLLRKCSWTIES